MAWSPSPEVRARGEQITASRAVPYVGGSQLTDESEQIQRSIEPGTAELRDYIRRRWGLVVGAGRPATMISAHRRPDGSLRRRDLHEDGRALDVMLRPGQAAIGDEIASWLVSHADAIGAQYVIWDRYEWSAAPFGPAWEPYDTSADRDRWGRRRDPHTDHVHVELSPAWSSDRARMRAALGLPALAASPSIEPRTPASSPRPADDDGRTVPSIERPREAPASTSTNAFGPALVALMLAALGSRRR